MVAIAFLIPLALLIKQVAYDRAVAEAERQTAVIVSVLAVTSDPSLIERVIASADGDADGQIAVHNLTGYVIGNSQVPAAEIRAAAHQDQTVEMAVPGGIVLLEPVEVGRGRTAVVEVHVPDSALTAGVGRAQFALVVVATGLVLGSAVVGDQLATRIVRPARNLARAATALGDGDLDVRVPPSGPQELAEAGLAFNQMADRLASLRTAEREMVADLSHRLRTPLTGLRLDVEALEASEYPPGAGEDGDRHRTVVRVRQALATLEQEIDVLIRTTREATARTTSQPRGGVDGADGREPARCDAGEVVAERMSFWSAVAADQDRPCEVFGTATPSPVPVPAPELAAALDAVLGNAFRYTPQGTALEVVVSRHDGYVAVRVDDAGPGIVDPRGALRRGTSGRGSTGLGLDIARRVARAGGGSVSLDRARELGGASVVMILADADAPPPPPPSRRGLIGRLTREPRKWTHAARAPRSRR
jgi:signal transduction histidine kinase